MPSEGDPYLVAGVEGPAVLSVGNIESRSFDCASARRQNRVGKTGGRSAQDDNQDVLLALILVHGAACLPGRSDGDHLGEIGRMLAHG